MDGLEIRAILALNIKAFRNRRNWSQADLAEKAGVSVAFLSNIERGMKWPHPDTLAKIAMALEVDIIELFHKENPMVHGNREYTARVIKELLLAQKIASDKVQSKYYINDSEQADLQIPLPE